MVLILRGVVFFFLLSCAKVKTWKLPIGLFCMVVLLLIWSDTEDLALGCPSFMWRFPIRSSSWAFFSFFTALKITVHFIISGVLNLMKYVTEAQEILAIVIFDHLCSGHCSSCLKCFFIDTWKLTPHRPPQWWPKGRVTDECYELNCVPFHTLKP